MIERNRMRKIGVSHFGEWAGRGHSMEKKHHEKNKPSDGRTG